MPIIPVKRSLIPAADWSIRLFGTMLQETYDLPGIGGYKLSAYSALEGDWNERLKEAQHYGDVYQTNNGTRKPLILDGQKFGNDPAVHVLIGALEAAKDKGFAAVILYPFASPVVQYEVTEAAKRIGMPLIVGGKFTCSYHTEGGPKDDFYTAIFERLGLPDMDGYISESAADRIYMLAARQGVTAFSLPGNDLKFSKRMKEKLDKEVADPEYFAPGFRRQGGSIREAIRVFENFHAFVGRELTEADDMRSAAIKLIAELEAA